MSEETEIEMKYCEYCQEYIPVQLDTGDVDTGCGNALCPFGVMDFDTDEVVELNFDKDNEVNRDDELDTRTLVNDSEGC